MTFLERFGSFENYQKESSLAAMKQLEKGMIYSKAYCGMICVFTKSELDLNKEELEEKRKIVEAIEYHKRIQAGERSDPVYLAYWRALYDKEYPEWRE